MHQFQPRHEGQVLIEMTIKPNWTLKTFCKSTPANKISVVFIYNEKARDLINHRKLMIIICANYAKFNGKIERRS